MGYRLRKLDSDKFVIQKRVLFFWVNITVGLHGLYHITEVKYFTDKEFAESIMSKL